MIEQATPAALALRVEGLVQGVGFRPFVWRLATRHGLAGSVRNDDGAVEILVEGDQGDLERFCAGLLDEAPPLAQVDALVQRPIDPRGHEEFVVESSRETRGGRRLVTPDAVTCAECLAEVADPTDRRFRYPFTNCTRCGPRFTVIDDLPYDRERTSLCSFPLCPACRAEYGDPGDRRFHAEPVACPACGPTLSLVDPTGDEIDGDPFVAAAALLRAGAIVAVKGLGGYQLACDATDEAAVARLRRRKHRPHKPLAVMVADRAQAAERFRLRSGEDELLASAAGPIVLVEDRGTLAPSIAPGHRRIGVLLPTTPLHHLLVREVGRPLVMTSGNRSDEPIAIGDDEARRALGGIADAFLAHDRRVAARYDDSVAAVRRGAPVVLRRARGYAPTPVRLPCAVAPTLAVGGDLQAAFCLAEGTDAFVSPHIGDLDRIDTIEVFRAAIEHHCRLLRIEPALVAHDRHPDLTSTRVAESFDLPRVAVGHHHAHIASVLAEHRVDGPVLGLALDGMGLGEDGTLWGGELLVGDARHVERVGHLRPVAQPGGDAAVRHPARLALAHALDTGDPSVVQGAAELLGMRWDEAASLLGGGSPRQLAAQVDAGVASPRTSSAGRLFDAVAALTGLCRTATYEAQPAVLVEQAALGAAGTLRGVPRHRVSVELVEARAVVDTRPLVAGVVDDLRAGVAVEAVAMEFHRWLAAALVALCRGARRRRGAAPDTVCLGGGVWANGLLLELVVEALEQDGCRVLFPRAVPPGDGGLALGQVLIAHHLRQGGA